MRYASMMHHYSYLMVLMLGVPMQADVSGPRMACEAKIISAENIHLQSSLLDSLLLVVLTQRSTAARQNDPCGKTAGNASLAASHVMY